MTNTATLVGKVLDTPKIRTFETRAGAHEVVSIWIEVAAGERADRFTVEVHCPRQAVVAKALSEGVLVEVHGALRHDRWKDKSSGKWIGKVFLAIDPGCGVLRSKGRTETASQAEETAA
jgi:single-stranded DNA-binding protein